jgi:hypothetical protein
MHCLSPRDTIIYELKRGMENSTAPCRRRSGCGRACDFYSKGEHRQSIRHWMNKPKVFLSCSIYFSTEKASQSTKSISTATPDSILGTGIENGLAPARPKKRRRFFKPNRTVGNPVSAPLAKGVNGAHRCLTWRRFSRVRPPWQREDATEGWSSALMASHAETGAF